MLPRLGPRVESRVPSVETPRAILFDLDATLIDGAGVTRATELVCEHFAAGHPDLGVDAVQLANANGAAWKSSAKDFENRWARGEIDDNELSAIVWSRTFSSLGLSTPEVLAAEVARTHVLALEGAMRPFEDALPALDALAVAGIPLGVVTNGSSSAQRAKVDILGDERFAFVAVSGEHGIAKPDAGLFEIALTALDHPAHGVVHVGDNLIADIGGARSVGIGSVWINRAGAARPAGTATPDSEITSLLELPAALGLPTGSRHDPA